MHIGVDASNCKNSIKVYSMFLTNYVIFFCLFDSKNLLKFWGVY